MLAVYWGEARSQYKWVDIFIITVGKKMRKAANEQICFFASGKENVLLLVAHFLN